MSAVSGAGELVERLMHGRIVHVRPGLRTLLLLEGVDGDGRTVEAGRRVMIQARGARLP